MSKVRCYEYTVELEHSDNILEGFLYPSNDATTNSLKDFILEIHELDSNEVKSLRLEVCRMTAP